MDNIKKGIFTPGVSAKDTECFKINVPSLFLCYIWCKI